jgi:hypothetical protein
MTPLPFTTPLSHALNHRLRRAKVELEAVVDRSRYRADGASDQFL